MRRRVELDTVDTDTLLSKGVAAARVGEHDEARRYLDEVVSREPDRADAWLWLASVEAEPRRKRDHFRRVLDLRPDDSEAKAGLERLADKYGASVLADDQVQGPLACTWHPERETLLRCARCGRPMCTSCAVRHPVGLRCKGCVRELRSPVYSVSAAGYLRGGATALALALLAGGAMVLMSRYGLFFWLVAFFVGAGIGTFIADSASRAAGLKRGRGMQLLVALSIVLGVVMAAALVVLGQVQGRVLVPGQMTALVLRQVVNLGVLIYLFVSISAAAARLK